MTALVRKAANDRDEIARAAIAAEPSDSEERPLVLRGRASRSPRVEERPRERLERRGIASALHLEDESCAFGFVERSNQLLDVLARQGFAGRRAGRRERVDIDELGQPL